MLLDYQELKGNQTDKGYKKPRQHSAKDGEKPAVVSGDEEEKAAGGEQLGGSGDK